MKKRIVLHTGFPKTGSSALQAYFSSNQAILGEAGIDYPNPEPDAVVSTGNCSGNVMQILQRDGFFDRYQQVHLDSARHGHPVVAEMWEDLIERLLYISNASTQPTILFSGEVMCAIPLAGWQKLAGRLDDFDVQVVAFIRDPYDFMLSAWCQQVKTLQVRPGMDFSTFTWLRGNDASDTVSAHKLPRPFTAPAQIVEAGLPFALLNYDTYRKDIVGAFFDAAALSRPVRGIRELAGERYNRSLSYSEAVLLQMLRVHLGNNDFAATVRNMLLARENRPGRSHYSRKSDESILRTLAPHLKVINTLVQGDKLRTEPKDLIDTDERIDPEDLKVVLEAIRRVSHTPEKAPWAPLRRAARGAPDAEGSGPEGLPPDFDPDAYLVHNPDVAAAGVDPADHYIRFGRKEMRRYRLA